jgi:hypothetical protein
MVHDSFDDATKNTTLHTVVYDKWCVMNWKGCRTVVPKLQGHGSPLDGYEGFQGKSEAIKNLMPNSAEIIYFTCM